MSVHSRLALFFMAFLKFDINVIPITSTAISKPNSSQTKPNPSQ